jgi:ATP-dependent Clp protease ATP-binding subunit ClpC
MQEFQTQEYASCAEAKVQELNAFLSTTLTSHASNALTTTASTACKQGSAAGSIDLLVSLANEDGCSAQVVMMNVGISPNGIGKSVTLLNEPSLFEPEFTVTPRLERILRLADCEATDHNSALLTTLHLLKAIIYEGNGVASLVLETPGLGMRPLLSEIERFFNEEADNIS